MKIEFSDEQVNIMQNALTTWSAKAQLACLVEECAELIVAIQKQVNRGKDNVAAILDEIADVEIMMAQCRLHLGITDEDLRERITFKMDKVQKALGN
ncbi:MAG: hypothetical protein FWC95_06290 [Defluviitaleaceae bacterium]|nr:hypothetical protein [Defluviitaleaceae bacterium]